MTTREEGQPSPMTIHEHILSVRQNDIENERIAAAKEQQELTAQRICEEMLRNQYDDEYVEAFRGSTFRIIDIKQYQLREFPESADAASDAYNRLFDAFLSMSLVEDSRMKYIQDSSEANLPLALLVAVDTSTLPGVQEELVDGYLRARALEIADTSQSTHELAGTE